MVETRPRALQRQQIVLNKLGYYKGKLDGIWGPASITAKRKFELSGKFSPAIPSGGLPFDLNSKLPKGVLKDPSTPGLITVSGLTDEEIKELISRNTTAKVDTFRQPQEVKHEVEAKPETVEPSSNSEAELTKKQRRKLQQNQQ